MSSTETSTIALIADQASVLQTRLNSLPREIYDLIQNFTILAFIHSGPQEISIHSRPQRELHKSQLAILQLSRSIRAQYAEAFYRYRTFTTFSSAQPGALLRWLDSMPAAHRAFVGGIAVRTIGDVCVHPYCLHSVLSLVERRFGIEVAGKLKWVSGRFEMYDPEK